MAVVFISPKQRQKMFFVGITIMFLIFLIVVSLGVFVIQPREVSQKIVFNETKVNIDMKVFDSDQFKKLQSFPEMPIQYSYKARIGVTSNYQTGFILAANMEEARGNLLIRGLNVVEIKEAEIGRDNPFEQY